MAKQRKRLGTCRICGYEGLLSYEHLPPKSAFNRTSVRSFSFQQWMNDEHSKHPNRGRVQQRGSGDYVLCEKCNNFTGRHYVPEFNKWSRVAADVLRTIPLSVLNQPRGMELIAEMVIPNTKPLYFVKQIAAMALAVNAKGFRAWHKQLAEFVLDNTAMGLPAGYSVYTVLYAGPNSRRSGITGSLDLNAGATTLTTEIAHPPLAYLMTFDEQVPPLRAGNVTRLADYTSGTVGDVRVRMPLGYGHTIFPGDFRSKTQVEIEARASVETTELLDQWGKRDPRRIVLT